MKRFVICIILTVMVLVGSIVVMRSTNATTASAQAPCPENWPEVFDRSEQERCAAEKMARAEREVQQAIQASRNAPARATSVPVALTGTPVPDGYIRDEDKRIEVIPLPEVRYEPTLRRADSIWSVGGVAYELGSSTPLYLYSMSSTNGKKTWIAYHLPNSSLSPKTGGKYNKDWLVPKEVGKLTITNVSGPLSDGQANVISFTTSSGISGTFTPATEEWTFSQ